MVMLNLVYRNQVPDFAKFAKKSPNDFTPIVIFFIACGLNYNGLYFTTFVLFPTYFAGAFAQQLVMSKIYAIETTFYPPGFPRQSVESQT